MKIIKLNINDIKPYKNNAKIHTQEQIEQIKKSIEEFGMNDPIAVWGEENIIVEGHGRLEALKQLGYTEVDCIRLDHLTDEERKAYTLAHNKLTMNTDFDFDILNSELEDIEDIDMSDFGFDLDFEDKEKEVEEDDFDIDANIPEEPKAKYGNIYQLGKHRLMCGDSTKEEDVAKLMNGVKADMVFTDPPYGMKKENDGVANDNLNFDDLLEFNKKWIPITFNNLKDNGSWYCWGIDEPLMDIYSNILKPKIRNQEIVFRNLITWFKNPSGLGDGQNNPLARSYGIITEKCLFVMCGVQGFNNNADNYFEGYEPIRKYLEQEAKKVKLNDKKLKELCGVGMYGHWFTKSQWDLMKEEYYLKLQTHYKNQAFKKEYQEIKKEYQEIKKEYQEIKNKWYETRAYFNNTHEKMTEVWQFDRTTGNEKESAGGHATPKPIALCTRAIKSSSRENENVLDVFGGSGSTLIACEQNNRNCYVMELEPKWVDVIIKRWEDYTGGKAVKIRK